MVISKKMMGFSISRLIIGSSALVCCAIGLGFGLQYLNNPGALATLGYLNTKNITLIMGGLLIAVTVAIVINRFLLMIQSRIKFGKAYKKNSMVGDALVIASIIAGTLYILSRLHDLQKSSNASFALLIERLDTIKNSLPIEFAKDFGDFANMANALTDQQIHDEVLRLQQFLYKISLYVDGITATEKAEKIAQMQILFRETQIALGGVERDNAGIKLIVQFMVVIAAVALGYLIGRAWKHFNDARYKDENTCAIGNDGVKNKMGLKRFILAAMPITLDYKKLDSILTNHSKV